jgi:4-amino-4-deoxy-L-arabinose transferase-like glycosyltransferase
MSAVAAPSASRLGTRVLDIPEASLVFAALAAWTALVYLPFYRLDGPDDSFYVEAAHLWTRGLPLYAGAFDVKAPGFFAILAAAQLVFGANLATLRGVTIVFTALAATALYALARARSGRPAAILCAGLFPILFEIFGDAAYATLCAFTGLAFLAALSRAPLARRAALGGLAIGAACAVKQTAALEAIALMAILASDPSAEGRALKILGAFVACASLAPLGFAAYYAARGDFGVFFADVAVHAIQRPEAAADAISFGAGLRRSVTMQFPIFPLTLCAIAAFAARRRLPPGFPLGAVVIWLAATWLAFVLQHGISAYYLAPALAPLLLLASAALDGLAKGAPRALILAVFAAAVVYCAVAFRGAAIMLGLQPVDGKALAIAAAAIEAAGPGAADTLFVVSRGGWLNSMTNLAPPTPYFHWFHTLCDFPGAGAGRLAEALAARPRFLVLADPAKRFGCELDSHRSLVRDAVASSYRPLIRAEGDFDTYGVYELR